jgi:hypothetical protein
MNNITLRCVRATIVAVEKQQVLYILSVFVDMYPACNAHSPYCHLWPVWLYHVFPHYLTNSIIKKKKVIEHRMYVLTSYTTFAWNISHSVNNWARYDKKCILVFMQITCYSCQILMILEFLWQRFEKYSDIKFHENPSSGSRVVPCRQTDGRTDMMKLIVTFRNFVKVPKMKIKMNV